MSGMAWAVGVLVAAGPASGPLTLDVEVDPTIVVPTTSQEESPAAPHVASVRVTLTNVSEKERVLRFACPCFLGFEVETPDGSAAPPDRGPMACTSVVTEIALPAGAAETRELTWTARAWDGSYRPLPAGRYTVFGTMGHGACGADQEGHSPMRTAPVRVEVRPAAH